MESLEGAFNSVFRESIVLAVGGAGASAAVFNLMFNSGQDLESHYVHYALLLAVLLAGAHSPFTRLFARRIFQFFLCEAFTYSSLFLALSNPSRDVLLCSFSTVIVFAYSRFICRWPLTYLRQMLVKQVTFWWLTSEVELATNLACFCPLLLAVYIVATASHSENIHIDVEGQAMKHFLDRLYCGVIILHSDELCFANTSMQRFFHTSDLQEMYTKFRKVPGLNMKLRRFVRLREEWSHFGTFPLEGKSFEWIGCRMEKGEGCTVAVICREIHVKETGETVSKSELIRSMSHDLKTPINCIMHMSEELISAAEMPSSGGQKCQVISSYCHFMSYLINDMVDYSEVVSGARIALRRSKVQLRQLVKSCVEMVAVFAEVKRLKIEHSIDAHLPEYIITDQSRLTQVILNLLSNAIKYTLKGTIKLVVLSVSTRKMKVLIEDSGIGMDPQHVKSLFQDNKSDKTLSTEGIGLVLANAIAQALGFEAIQAVSELGHGTTFSFCVYTQELFPCEATPYLAPMSPMLDVGGVDRHQCAPVFLTSGFIQCREERGADILLVDDYPFNRMVIKTILTKEGLSSHEAENGQVAIEMIRKQNQQRKHYRLILMDIDMPVLDGIKTTDKLIAMQMSDPEFVVPPIVGHSAFTSDADIAKFLSVGMQGFIPKPFIRSTAMDLIWKLMIPSCR